jgi:hypothetical protein
VTSTFAPARDGEALAPTVATITSRRRSRTLPRPMRLHSSKALSSTPLGSLGNWSYPGLVEGLGLSFGEGVLAPTFVLKGGQIVQGRVSTMGVVPCLDGLEDGHAGLGRGLEPAAIQQLALQGDEEGLGHGVVIAIPDRAHRGAYPGGLTAVSEGDGGVLTALIGVVDDLLWPALGESHLQRIEHQLAGGSPSPSPPPAG